MCGIKIDERSVNFIFYYQFTNTHVVRWNNFKVLDIAVLLESDVCNTRALPFPEVQWTFRKCV